MVKLRIKHNISSLNTFNNLEKRIRKTSSSMEKLSSGLQINKAADNAAGLAISEKMRAQIRGLEQSNKNTLDALSLIHTAEAGLFEIGESSLLRIRELAVEAANDILTSQDRSYIQEEIDQLKMGINEIANNTHFNNINLLNQIVSESSENKTIISQGRAAHVMGSTWLPNTFNVSSGLNDTIEFRVNGVTKEIQISSGTYSGNTFLEEVNSKLQDKDIPLKASFSGKTTKIEFTSPIGDYNIESITGKWTEGYLLQLSEANRTSGVQIGGLPVLSPSVTIDAGVNDTLTFDIDSTTYSITLSPGTYNVYGANQSDLNKKSPLLKEINNQLQNAHAPVKADFIYYAVPDPPFNNGAGLFFTALESADGTSYLSDGNHTFGNFGGNAKSTLYDQIVNGWIPTDSSTIKSGTIKTYPASVTGEADLSDGLVIIAGKNDTLNLDINGQPQAIILRPNSYNAKELIKEINEQFSINGIELEAANLNNLNKLVISQTAPFDGDSINNISGNAMLELFYEVSQGEAPITKIDPIPSQGILTMQVGPNAGHNFELTLTDVRTSSLGIDRHKVDSRIDAEDAITLIDKAIKKVSSERGKFGAYQNRLEHISNNISVASENLISAESRIRDVDYALAA